MAARGLGSFHSMATLYRSSSTERPLKYQRSWPCFYELTLYHILQFCRVRIARAGPRLSEVLHVLCKPGCSVAVCNFGPVARDHSKSKGRCIERSACSVAVIHCASGLNQEYKQSIDGRGFTLSRCNSVIPREPSRSRSGHSPSISGSWSLAK